MSNILINQIPLSLLENSVSFFYSFSEQRNLQNSYWISKNLQILIKKVWNQSELSKLIEEKITVGMKWITFSFIEPDSEDHRVMKIDLLKQRYFIPIYVLQQLEKHFLSKGLILGRNFIGDIEIWEKSGIVSELNSIEYKIFNLRIDKADSEYFITLGLDSQSSLIYQKPINQIPNIDQEIIRKILIGEKIYRIENFKEEEIKNSFPIVSNSLRKILFNQNPLRKKKFSYKNYLIVISQFYQKYLQGNEIAGNIKIFASGMRTVSESDIFYTPREKNILEFGNNQFDFNPYTGFINFGPYKLPKNANNIKFIFIFHKNDRDDANILYKYLKYGYRHFPGLQSFAKIPFDLDIDNTIKFENRNEPIPEIQEKLDKSKLSEDITYIALFISPFAKEVENEKHKQIYYKVKEELLKRNISSQVIELDSLKSQDIHFYLPNIAIAILAKAGGIPWKLKREKENFLMLGFGEKRIKNVEGIPYYIGNTVCFDNEGIFRDLSCFIFDYKNLKQNIENALRLHIKQNGPPSKLIIHYFKNWSKKENKELIQAFNNLDIDIPYVVLEVNDNKAKDYICFDMSYEGRMPLSGTIIQLRYKREYLLFNNQRYSSNMASYKGQDEYPIKIRIETSKHTKLDEKEIKTLLDQVYQFSRLYWRSIKQKANPATIEYSKMLAEKVIYFENKNLPNTTVSKQTVWFI